MKLMQGKIHNPHWLQIPDHSFIIITVGGSGSGKRNALLNLIYFKENDDKWWHWQNVFVC